MAIEAMGEHRPISANKRRDTTIKILVALLCCTGLAWTFRYYHDARHVTSSKELNQEHPASPHRTPNVTSLVLPPPVPKPTVAGSRNPTQTVLSLIQELKASEDPTVVLKYVAWDVAFEKLAPNQKSALGIDSAEGLRKYYLEFYTNPNLVFIRDIKKRLENFPPPKREELRKFILTQESVRVAPQRYTRIQDQYFEIVSEKVENASAEVELSISEKGEYSRLTLFLVPIKGHWLLECFQLIKDPLSLCKSAQTPIPSKALN